MKVLIPAGGMGTRLRPHTLYTPKPLLFVAGDTIIGHIFSMLDKLEIDEYRIVNSPETSLPRLLREYYPDYNFTFWQQTEPMGLGHAVLQGLSDLGNEPILILLSDTIIPFDIRKALAGLKDNEGFLVAKEVDDPRRFGVIELSGKYVSKLVEKPEHPNSNLAICGIYYIPSAQRLRESLEELVRQARLTRGEYQLTDALSTLVERGEKLLVVKVNEWIDCGTKQALIEANRTLLKRNSRTVPLSGSLIKPPCWIGEDVIIENSIVGPNVSMASGVRISNSILSDCIVNRNAKVQGMVLKETIVGEEAVLDASIRSFDIGPFSCLKGF